MINLLGRVHMDSLDDPFAAVDKELEACPLGAVADAIVVDMHAEATSEKMAMGHFCDGRASLVVGTHTHVPTADCQILTGGTAYQTDAGACADYDSVIGNQKEEPLRRFTTRISGGRYKPAEGPATVCGVFVETDNATGLARRVEPIRIGGRLSETVPVVEAVDGRLSLRAPWAGPSASAGCSRLSRVSLPVFRWSSLAKRRSVMAIHSASVTLPSRSASAAAIGCGSLIRE